jgi:hypothetical protein
MLRKCFKKIKESVGRSPAFFLDSGRGSPYNKLAVFEAACMKSGG